MNCIKKINSKRRARQPRGAKKMFNALIVNDNYRQRLDGVSVKLPDGLKIFFRNRKIFSLDPGSRSTLFSAYQYNSLTGTLRTGIGNS